MAVFVRKDIWKLEADKPWDDVTLAYAIGVRIMQERADDDPTSWKYQGAIHAAFTNSSAEFHNRCQHHTWYFLPWHRMYLYWFEQMLRAAIATSPDVDAEVAKTWALPYWNYEGEAKTRSLPPAFREQTLPDGSANPLFVEERDYLNDGNERMPTTAARSQRALDTVPFSNRLQPGMAPGFGGYVTQFHHWGELTTASGAVEATPHNTVHGEVGGLMGDPRTAPLDPIFWLHHCNIDRLWAIWDADTRPFHEDPSGDWLAFEFRFHDAKGVPQTSIPKNFVDTEALDYTYEELSRPTARRRGRVPTDPPPDTPPELVGATEDKFELAGQPLTVEVPISEPTGPARRRGARGIEAGDKEARVYLNVENIEAERNPGGNYGVYINLPDEDEDPTNDDFHVGNISFFGIEYTSDRDQDTAGGGGMRYAFDITDLVHELQDQNRWDPERVKVTFAPLRSGPARRAGKEVEPTPVSIGRVSFFVQ